MPHIFFCLHREFPPKNSTTHYNYARYLVKNGFRVSVVAGNEINKSVHEFIDGINVYRINTKFNNALSINPIIYSIKAYNLISKITRNEKNTILHQISFPNLGFVIYPPPFFMLPKNKVLDIRGTAVRSELLDRLSCRFIKFQSRLFENVLVISEVIAERLGIKSYDVMPVGVDTSLFRDDKSKRKQLRDHFGQKENDLLFIYVGNLNPKKRLENAIKSLCLARKRLKTEKGINISLLIVGDGPALEKLKGYARSLCDHENSVIFLGPKSHHDVPNYLGAADIGFAYIPESSQYFYQPPIKTYEYLASGLCTIATKTKGHQEIITDNRNGKLVDDSVAALVDAIIQISTNSELRKNLAFNARKSVLDYDYDKIVSKSLIPFYERLVK